MQGQTCYEPQAEASLNWTSGLLAQDTLQPSPSAGRTACERGEEASVFAPELWELPERKKRDVCRAGCGPGAWSACSDTRTHFKDQSDAASVRVWGIRGTSAARCMGLPSMHASPCFFHSFELSRRRAKRDVGRVKAARVVAAMSELLRPSASASGRHTDTVATGSSGQVQYQCGQLTSDEGCHPQRNDEETCASMGIDETSSSGTPHAPEEGTWATRAVGKRPVLACLLWTNSPSQLGAEVTTKPISSAPTLRSQPKQTPTRVSLLS